MKPKDTPDRTFNSFSKKIASYAEVEQKEILSAAEWSRELHAGQKRASGEPYFVHPIAVAEILIYLKLDYRAIIAALLHDVLEDTQVGESELESRFGGEVLVLVNGVTKITLFPAESKSIQNVATIRKMLFAMVKDIRVILIKLADKLHNMRTLEYLERQKSREMAKECLDIYSPLAGRLGISWIKDELEDLSLKCLQPDNYEQIKSYMVEKKVESAGYLERIKKDIYRAAAKEGLEISIVTRAKHLYSIYYKMKKRGKRLDEIYDFLGIRILCNDTVECYTILGLIHKLWKPLDGRFKDYIAMPKANRYQSLHTTVMGYGGRLIEIQIRTNAMNQTAEYGVAAHWFYKQGAVRGNRQELTIINKIRSWNSDQQASSTFLAEIKNELLRDSIYVFTPKGDVIELPRGATPIDFAYHIHTEVGNRCLGCKADGHIVPLKKTLRNTQVVEILTSRNAHPCLNWLRYAKTHRARSKIRQWLNRHTENLIGDHSIVLKKGEKGEKEGKGEKNLLPGPGRAGRSRRRRSGEGPGEGGKQMGRARIGIRIGQEQNIMIKMAGCCHPEAGDRIVGYISRGRGIIIHKEDCISLSYIKDFQERNIKVEWEPIPGVTGKSRFI